MNTGEITNPTSGNIAPDTVVSSQGGQVEATEAWDITKGAKSLVNWIGKLRSRNKGDQPDGNEVLSEVLVSSPGMRAVDVEPSSRAIQDYLPQIRELADEMQTIGVQPYQSALDHANSPQGVVSVVTPEMERLEQVLGRVDASRAQLEQETRPVTDAIDTLVKFDELEAIMGAQEGRGSHAITDQYQAQVSAFIRATIESHQTSLISKALEAGAPYPPAVALTTQQVALKAISFVESVWQALGEVNKTEPEILVVEQTQSLDTQGEVKTSTVTSNTDTQQGTTTAANTGKTTSEIKVTSQTPQQTSATQIEALITALPISTAEQDKVRTELDFILTQYSQALQTDPVQALMSSTSVVPIVQEHIEQSRSDIANIPAVVQAGRELAPLFSQLEEVLKADPTVRARIASRAIERISALLAPHENPNKGAGSIEQNLETIRTLLQEYAKLNLTRERAKAIREEMKRIADTLASEADISPASASGTAEQGDVDPGDEHDSILTRGLGTHDDDPDLERSAQTKEDGSPGTSALSNAANANESTQEDKRGRWRKGFKSTLSEAGLPTDDWMLDGLEARRQRQNLSGGSNFPFDTVGEARKILEERESAQIGEDSSTGTPALSEAANINESMQEDNQRRWRGAFTATLLERHMPTTDWMLDGLERKRQEQIAQGGDRFPFDIVGEARRILEEKSKEEEKNRAVPIGELTPPDDQAEKEKRIIEFWKGSGYSQEKIEDLLEKRRKRIPDRSKQPEFHTPLRLTGTTVAQDRALDAANRWEEGLRSVLGDAKMPQLPELLAKLERRRLELIRSHQDRFRIDWAQEARKILGEIEESKGVLYLQEDASRNIDWIRGNERKIVIVTNDGKEFPAAVLGKNSDGNPIMYMERAITNGRRFFSPHDTPKDSEFNIEDSDYVIRGKVVDILANRQNQQFADSVKLEITIHHR